MIPAEIIQFLKTMDELPYVLQGTKAASKEIHECVKRYIQRAKASVCIELDEELAAKAEMTLNLYGWTLEEMAVLFFMWCVTCPDKMQVWWKQRKKVNADEGNPDIDQL